MPVIVVLEKDKIVSVDQQGSEGLTDLTTLQSDSGPMLGAGVILLDTVFVVGVVLKISSAGAGGGSTVSVPGSVGSVSPDVGSMSMLLPHLSSQ